MIEKIEILLNYTSQAVAIYIHERMLDNSRFGLFNANRRVFFDVKHKTAYQIKGDKLTAITCENDQFIALIKLTLITCKRIMDPMDELKMLTHIKLIANEQEAKKIEAESRPAPDGQSPKNDIS